jgi:hypothetical protein
MTDLELMDKAWDYLAGYTVGERPNASDVNDLVFALESRLAQPETPDVTPEVTPYVINCPRCGHCCPQHNQEPVAWMYVNLDGECEQIEYEAPPDDPSVTPLFTTPQQRQWVGLTDHDYETLSQYAFVEVIEKVEELLKEKNT